MVKDLYGAKGKDDFFFMFQSLLMDPNDFDYTAS